jgi:hypothetical protein
MALIPKLRYPLQTETTDGWPHGKAKNKTTAGDNDGTPLERDWVNDIWGFLQSLLNAAGIAPSGSPDQLEESQYLQAIEQRINAGVAPTDAAVEVLASRVQALENITKRLAVFTVNGQTVGSGARLNLTESIDARNYYSEDFGWITVGGEGYYEIHANVIVSAVTHVVPAIVGLRIRLEDTVLATALMNEIDSSQLSHSLSVSTIVQVTNEDTQRINLTALADSGGTLTFAEGGSVAINRIG